MTTPTIHSARVSEEPTKHASERREFWQAFSYRASFICIDCVLIYLFLDRP